MRTGSLVPFLLVPILASPTVLAQGRLRSSAEESAAALPRWREGGTPIEDHTRPLAPFAVHADLSRNPPATGLVASPNEYDPIDGVLFRYSTSGWPQVVVDCVAALTGDPGHDEIAYVVVSGASQQSVATTAFSNAGADLAKVQFLVEGTNSIWLRDYGPHFAWQAGTRVIVDSHYYPTRPIDNFVPTVVAGGTFEMPAYAMGLYYSGGNFQPGPNRSGYVTSLVQQDNPDLSLQEIADLYRDFQGIDTLHVLPRLPSSVDGTGHIDMWMYLVDEDTVVISEFLPGSNATAIQVTNDAVPYMQNLGFTVHRTPAWNVGFTHYTYANAFRVNDRIFVPSYGDGNASYLDEDAQALATWQAAAGPGVTIVPIDCYDIIPAAGAIHCIVMQVPRHASPLPSAHVLSPAGGEILPWNRDVDVAWSADDDGTIDAVDLYYSTDGGTTFPHPIATGLADTGQHTWTVPPHLAPADARVRVVAHDDSGNQVTADGPAGAALGKFVRRVHDFSTGVETDKWAWGHQTSSWTQLDGIRHPAAASTSIEVLRAGAYAAIASSNATGSDGDTNRYRAPVPSGSSESTHVFEFRLDERLDRLAEIEILWEGYGDACLQVELYVWDDVAGNWSDVSAGSGANAYAANWAGNVDGVLRARITEDFARYVDANGLLTFLVYGERPGEDTFCDYVAVTTTAYAAQTASTH